MKQQLQMLGLKVQKAVGMISKKTYTAKRGWIIRVANGNGNVPWRPTMVRAAEKAWKTKKLKTKQIG